MPMHSKHIPDYPEPLPDYTEEELQAMSNETFREWHANFRQHCANADDYWNAVFAAGYDPADIQLSDDTDGDGHSNREGSPDSLSEFLLYDPTRAPTNGAAIAVIPTNTTERSVADEGGADKTAKERLVLRIPSLSTRKRMHGNLIMDNQDASTAPHLPQPTSGALPDAKNDSPIKKKTKTEVVPQKSTHQVLPASKPVSSTRKGRGRPPNPSTAALSSAVKAPDTFTVSLTVEVILYPKEEKGRGGRVKFKEQDPLRYGPKVITQEAAASWEGFLEMLARLVQTKPDNLIVASMAWKWLKERGSGLPLTSPDGLTTMVGQIKANATPSTVVVVTMNPPKKNAKLLKATRALSLDKTLQPIVQQLQEQYPIGQCPAHPDVHCFLYAPLNLHYELTSARVRVWAHAISRKETDAHRIPFGAPFFKKEDGRKLTGTPTKHAAPTETFGGAQFPGASYGGPGFGAPVPFAMPYGAGWNMGHGMMPQAYHLGGYGAHGAPQMHYAGNPYHQDGNGNSGFSYEANSGNYEVGTGPDQWFN
ncbi:hypothetical protein CONPUDRAFT_161011 [Coniophora puteana RWD-64-598 SS2]|uniref:Uncharacterized protein n=1 Tax=Coniophora puteana (strain RWD-64-598) TaxID=741705 RepID=A0A5M3N450_CONPW|nr:uncharacterized protein CONPUDRAFT_161011 [Coniophora puteana RWD-64-598 SS2]EIW86200.1 hypothetical protein CONPUDRAFT_161011 [Coniophora puteana RWD-64-598 SS2]